MIAESWDKRKPIYMPVSGGHFLPSVRKLAATFIFAKGENAYRVPSGVGFPYWLMDTILTQTLSINASRWFGQKPAAFVG